MSFINLPIQAEQRNKHSVFMIIKREVLVDVPSLMIYKKKFSSGPYCHLKSVLFWNQNSPEFETPLVTFVFCWSKQMFLSDSDPLNAPLLSPSRTSWKQQYKMYIVRTSSWNDDDAEEEEDLWWRKIKIKKRKLLKTFILTEGIKMTTINVSWCGNSGIFKPVCDFLLEDFTVTMTTVSLLLSDTERNKHFTACTRRRLRLFTGANLKPLFTCWWIWFAVTEKTNT